MSTSPSALALSAKWLQQGVVARHETFCPRYGWLKKSVDRLSGASGRAPEPNVFDAPDAIEKLGVGRNMVRAMRFWGLAFKVIEPFNTESPRLTGPMQATELGRRLGPVPGRSGQPLAAALAAVYTTGCRQHLDRYPEPAGCQPLD